MYQINFADIALMAVTPRRELRFAIFHSSITLCRTAMAMARIVNVRGWKRDIVLYPGKVSSAPRLPNPPSRVERKCNDNRARAASINVLVKNMYLTLQTGAGKNAYSRVHDELCIASNRYAHTKEYHSSNS